MCCFLTCLEDRKKLDPKAKRCIFLGYGAQRKGYRLYDRENSCVIFSRDVIFNESSRGIDSDQEENQVIEVELPGNEESSAEMAEGITNEQTNPVTDEQPETDEIVPAMSIQRRTSTRKSRPPDYYDVRVYTATELQKEPETVEEALSCSEKEQWKAAMQKEMDSLYANNVWDLVELPSDRKTIGNKWVFKCKTNANGTVERFKARLVAQGFSQKQGLDYDETFSPVSHSEVL